jgi:hypothetical protein
MFRWNTLFPNAPASKFDNLLLKRPVSMFRWNTPFHDSPAAKCDNLVNMYCAF